MLAREACAAPCVHRAASSRHNPASAIEQAVQETQTSVAEGGKAVLRNVAVMVSTRDEETGENALKLPKGGRKKLIDSLNEITQDVAKMRARIERLTEEEEKPTSSRHEAKNNAQELFKNLEMDHYGMVEDASRYTTNEFGANLQELRKRLNGDESLAFHYTSGTSVELILDGHGLRASSVGQLGGGLSVCTADPVQLGWVQFGMGRHACGTDICAQVGMSPSLWARKISAKMHLAMYGIQGALCPISHVCMYTH